MRSSAVSGGSGDELGGCDARGGSDGGRLVGASDCASDVGAVHW